MNNTITVGQQLQEHGFAPEVRAVRAAAVAGEGAALRLGSGLPCCIRCVCCASCPVWPPSFSGKPVGRALPCRPAPTPPLPLHSTQVPVVVVTSFPDAVKTVLDASLKSIRGYK